MERVKQLGRYQKIVLVFMSVMVLVFTVIYPITVSREGFEYMDTILVPDREGGNTVYSGKIRGVQAEFTVSAEGAVEFQYGEKTYGPYTVTEDPTAIPEGRTGQGIELRCGEEILFRGTVEQHEHLYWLYHEDGSVEDPNISVITSENVITKDENGNIIDPMEPDVLTILELMSGPELSHKGEWIAWLGGVCICIITAISMLFAEELFHWSLVFRLSNAEQAEPSDLEIAGRYISWTVLPIAALILFVRGLR